MIKPLNIPFMELDDSHCREVMGKGEDGLAIYCGHAKNGDASYRKFHRQRNCYPAIEKLPRSLFRFGGRAA
jgi:hypothetical protein